MLDPFIFRSLHDSDVVITVERVLVHQTHGRSAGFSQNTLGLVDGLRGAVKMKTGIAHSEMQKMLSVSGGMFNASQHAVQTTM